MLHIHAITHERRMLSLPCACVFFSPCDDLYYLHAYIASKVPQPRDADLPNASPDAFKHPLLHLITYSGAAYPRKVRFG
jgi:hypothetical protein